MLTALVTLQDVKRYLGVTGTEHDVELTRFIGAVSRYVETYTQRILPVSDHAERHSGAGVGHLFVANWPIIAVTAVTGEQGPVVVVNDPAGWAIGKVTMYSGVFPIGSIYRVEYRAGYAVIPEDISLAVMECIAFHFRRSIDGNRVGVQSRSFDGGSTSYLQTLPETAMEVFNAYRSPSG